MKTPKQLFEEFKKMPLNKQTVVTTALIAGGVLALANYKNIKQGAKNFVDKITNDDNVKEFVEDVSTVAHGCSDVVKKYLKGESTQSEDDSSEQNTEQ